MEFENSETAVILQKKLLPVLEELARAEYGAFTFQANLDEETIAWMEKSEKTLEREIAAYLQALLKMHLKYGETVKEIWSQFQSRTEPMPARQIQELS